MKPTGNGDTDVCVGNLCNIIRGECCLQRFMGLPQDVIDRPMSTTAPELTMAAEWAVSQYEPRAQDIDVTAFFRR